MSYHHPTCLTHQEGPCDCGLEEALQDELNEETAEIINAEEAPDESSDG